MADKLAKLAKYLDVPKVWLEDIPSDVNSLGLIDSSFAEVWMKFLDGFLKKKKITYKMLYKGFQRTGLNDKGWKN